MNGLDSHQDWMLNAELTAAAMSLKHDFGSSPLSHPRILLRLGQRRPLPPQRRR